MHAASAIIILYIVYKFTADCEIPRGYIYNLIRVHVFPVVHWSKVLYIYMSPFIYQCTGQPSCKSE